MMNLREDIRKAVKRRPLRVLAAIISTFVLWLSISGLFLEAESGKLMRTIIFASLAWGSYLLIHQSLEGKMEDLSSELENTSFKDTFNDTRVFTAVTVGLIGFGVGSYFLSTGVIQDSYMVTTSGSALIITGYMAAHYLITGEPV